MQIHQKPGTKIFTKPIFSSIYIEGSKNSDKQKIVSYTTISKLIYNGEPCLVCNKLLNYIIKIDNTDLLVAGKKNLKLSLIFFFFN